MPARLLLALLLVAAAAPALGATCTSKASNNWNNAATWTCTGAGAGTTPANGDTVVIANGNAVTANVDANPASITVSTGNANTSLTLSTGVTLNVSGAVTINAATGGTARTKRITVNGTAQLLIGGNLSINNGGAAGSVADLTIANNAAASVQVAGNVTFSGTPVPSITFAGAGTLSVAGSMDNDGSLAAGTGTVTYTSNAVAQNIGTYTYATLLINKSGGSATAGTISASNLGIGTTSGAVAVTGTFNTTTAALSTSGGAALSLTGSLTATSSAALTTASGGALSLTGNLSAATATFTTASNAAITVNGAVSGTSASFTNAATGPVTITGALTSTNLTFASGNAGLTSVGANSSTGTLTFASGNTGLLTMAGGTTLTVTGNCTTSVTRPGSGHVNGILKLTYPGGTPICTYPIGDATNYTPITAALVSATAGTITGSVTASAPASLSISPLSSSKYVNRYWTLGAGGDTATATSYGVTLNWVGGDIQGGANYQNFIVAENQGGWVVPGPGVSANAPTSIVGTNITTVFTSAASFGVGEAYACLPPSNVPAGVTVGCVCDNFGRATLNPSTIFNSNWLLSTSGTGTFGIPKIVNQGRLELTDNTGNNATAATVPGIFPAAGNYISVEFQQYAYPSANGADGIAVTLSDYSVAPTPGAYGGSLGYAQKAGINGFAGGWIGVALDEYGNFENNTEGRSGGTPPCAGQCRDSVGIRGSGSGNAATATNYPWLAGNTAIGNIDSGTTPGPGYMYQIVVDARNYTAGAKTAMVSVNRDATTQTGANYATVVPAFDAYAVNPSQTAVPVNWQISFTGSTGGSTNIHEIGSLKICAQTLIAPTGSSTAAGFNAFDSALPNTKQNALFGHIYTKVAGVNFTLNVAALAPPVGGVSQGVNTAYASSGSKTVTVKLFDDSQAGGSCIASASACSACAKTVVATQTLTFAAGDAGFKTSGNFSFSVPGVYKRLIAQISDGTTTGCSVDAFAVRPASYALTSNAAPKTKAGVAFTITATPQSSGGTQYSGSATGSPTLDSTKAPAVSGTQTLLLQSWNPGATSGTFIYNDVGSFSLPANAIYDAQYGNASSEAQDRTNGDCNPGSGTPYVPATSNTIDAAGKFGCDIGSLASPSFGRFYPDHYEASLGVAQGCSADGFSYMGQPFSMTSASAGPMQVKALAAGQTFASAPGLPSYTGAYAFLADVWFAAQNGVASTDLIQCISSTQNPTTSRCGATTLWHSGNKSKAWTAGSFTVAPTTYYFDPPKDATTTPDATWGPYDLLNVGVTVSDSDGSTLTIPAGQSFVLSGVTYQTANGSLPMKMRYGRMRIQNASGSEQAPIMVPLLLEYWSGSAWTGNLLDASCTRLLGPPPTAYGGNGAAAACYGGAGGSGAQCTSTTAGGVGSIYTTQLSNVPANSGVPAYSAATFAYGQRNVLLAAPKAAGTLGVSVQAPAWLKIGPTNVTGTNPSATVRYSSYNSRFIFLRENY